MLGVREADTAMQDRDTVNNRKRRLRMMYKASFLKRYSKKLCKRHRELILDLCRVCGLIPR